MNLEESEIWAKSCYQDVVLVSDFMQLQVNPFFENIAKTSDRDVYIHGLFLRSLAWMLSLRKLNQSRDFQPIVSGARSLLETTVDLVLIHYDKTNSSGWKMRFWGASAKLKAAKTAIEYFKNRARKSIPDEYQDMENFILNEESTIESMRISLWADPKNPTKSKHPERWTGHGRDLLADVREADKLHGSVIEKHLGSNLEEFYETEYRRLNWNVHGSGLTGVREVEPEGINICAV